MPGQPIPTRNLSDPDCQYGFIPYHRGSPTTEKCVWTITEEEEVECFDNARQQGWIADEIGWGLRYSPEALDANMVSYRITHLGINFFQENLFIAKFVGNDQFWHGYPADYIRRSKADKPQMEILNAWRIGGMISKSQMSKILKSKPCSL